MGAIQGSINQTLGAVGAAAMAIDSMQEHKELRQSQKATSELNLRNAEEDYDAAERAQKHNETNIELAGQRAEHMTDALGRLPKGKKYEDVRQTLGQEHIRAIEEAHMYERAREELAASVVNKKRALEFARVEYGRFHRGVK